MPQMIFECRDYCFCNGDMATLLGLHISRPRDQQPCTFSNLVEQYQPVKGLWLKENIVTEKCYTSSYRTGTLDGCWFPDSWQVRYLKNSKISIRIKHKCVLMWILWVKFFNTKLHNRVNKWKTLESFYNEVILSTQQDHVF